MPKRKVGAPTKYKPYFHPSDFIAQSKQGKGLAQIARNWDVDRDSLYEWAKKNKEFSGALKKGKQLSEAWYMDIGQAAMLNKVMIEGRPVKVELGWFVWMTKNMFKWSDKVSVSAPTQLNNNRPLEHLTDEELDDL